jgi:hypothetical protein
MVTKAQILFVVMATLIRKMTMMMTRGRMRRTTSSMGMMKLKRVARTRMRSTALAGQFVHCAESHSYLLLRHHQFKSYCL